MIGQTRLYNVEIDKSVSYGFSCLSIINEKIYCFGSRQQQVFGSIRDIDSSHILTNNYTPTGSYYVAPGWTQPNVINDNIYIVGWHLNNGYESPYLMSLDYNLDTNFTTSFDFGVSASGIHAHVSLDEHIMFAGIIVDSAGALVDSDILIMKLDTMGSMLWHTIIGGYANDYASSIVNTRDSGYLVSGFATYSPQVERDPILVKLDRYGNVQWQIYEGSTIGGDHLNISYVSDSTFIRFGSHDNNTLSDVDSRFQLIDELGNVFWDTVHVFSDDLDSVEDIYVDSTGYTFLGPLSINGVGHTHIGKLDFNGNLLRHRTYGTRTTGSYITDIEPLQNGDIMCVGYLKSDTNHPNQDGWLMRLNCLGYDTLPRAKFNYQLDSTLYTTDSIQFNNLSLRAENYYWEFGDGQSYQHSSNPAMLASSIPNVKHVYTMPGTYIVKLHAIACQDTTTFLDTIFVDERPKLEGFYVYPNPTQNGVYIRNSVLDANSTYTLSVYSIDGRITFSKNVSGGELINEYYLDTPGWASGVYNGVINAGEERHNFRFVISRE